MGSGVLNMTDLFHEFFECFEKGNVSSALSKILPTPEVVYEELPSEEALLPHLVNLVDASVFGTLTDAKWARYVLLSLFNEKLSRLYPNSLALLKKEVEVLPSEGWRKFQDSKEGFASLLSKSQLHFSLPVYRLRYFLQPLPCLFSESSIPMVFLEPLDIDFKPLLTPLNGKNALFVFETAACFLQMLQFEEVVESLCEVNHLIYILDLHPEEQFEVQGKILEGKFEPYFITQRKKIEEALPWLLEALSDKKSWNDLYHIAKQLVLSLQQERLGKSRVNALLEKKAQEKWRDPHKELPSIAGIATKDYFLDKLAEISKKALPKYKKIRLVHVVPQIVDGGHAPSTLLENLIRYHNQERFELFLVSSERLQFHPLEYPYNYYTSDPSPQRAPKRLALFQSLGVNVHVLPNNMTYEQAAEHMAILLHQVRADVVVFHGPDLINTMTANWTDVPLKVLFEHGTPPTYQGFDLAILSSEGAVEIYKELLSKMDTEGVGLPFHVDLKQAWELAPFKKTTWGVPEDSLLMTTISGHLGNRLGGEMCLAIAEILKQVPNAYYAPLGPVQDKDKEKFKKIFLDHGVENRVVFLGGVHNPSQYARSMHLYLNEFPFGSCLGMLDAMAAGCPVVTMYDCKGPPQARYGGDYFGIERAVTSGKRSDYVNLACQLLQDPKMYKEWSEHASKRYEQQSDVAAYVKAFESIIEKKYAQSNDRKIKH